MIGDTEAKEVIFTQQEIEKGLVLSKSKGASVVVERESVVLLNTAPLFIFPAS